MQLAKINFFDVTYGGSFTDCVHSAENEDIAPAHNDVNVIFTNTISSAIDRMQLMKVSM